MSYEDDLDELGGEDDITLDDDLDSFDDFSVDSLELEPGEEEFGEPEGTETTLEEGGVYSLEIGEYTVQTPEGALSVDEGPEVVEGVAELVGDKLTVSEPSEVWLPEGTVLWNPFGKSAEKNPLEFSVQPASGNLSTTYTLTVTGAGPKNRVNIQIDKKLKIDPTLTSMTGSGTVRVTGETISGRAKLPGGQENKVTLYAHEVIKWKIDKKSNRETIYVITTGPPAEPAPTPVVEVPPGITVIPAKPGVTPWIPAPSPVYAPVTPPAMVTPAEASAGIKAGKHYFIKSTLPLLDMLPGLPYFEGIPILPGFRISDKM